MARVAANQQPQGLERLDEVIVRVSTWVALAFFAVLVTAGLVSGDGHYLRESINPAVIGAVGLAMLVRGSPRALVQLVVGGATIAVTIGLLDIGTRSGALLGLVSMGIVGTLLVRDRVIVFMSATGIGLFAIAYWWNVGDWIGRERVLEALTPALAFLFAAGLVAWLKSELLSENRRRLEASDALVASEEQFRMAFETAGATMALIGAEDGRFLRINQAGCEMLGYSKKELLGMRTVDVIHPDDREDSRNRQAALVAGEGDNTPATMRLVRSDGSIVYGLVSSGVATNARGDPLHLVSQLVDVTEERAAKQQLIDLLATRDELIASVSHELRTPLTAVLGYGRLLLESVPGSPPEGYELMLEEIVEQGSDLVAIIEDLLVFAQSDSNAVRVNRIPLDVRDQVTLVLESLKPQVSTESVIISGPRVVAIADPVRVRQVLRNLLSNASRYGGDTVVVEFAEDSQVRVVVSDNGTGVPPSDRERIFEPYQRSRPEDGLTAAIGVGLTVARRLARLMDGDLTYDYRDGYSRFELSLPPSRVSAVTSEETQDQPSA